MKSRLFNPALSIVIIAVILLLSCSDDDNPTNPIGNTDELWPLIEGNYWVYDYFDRTFDSSVVNITYRVDSSFVWRGNTWHQIDVSLDERLSVKWYLRNGSDGLYTFRIMDIDTAAGLLLKFPVSEGERFWSETEQDTFVVISVSAYVSVPAGRFAGCIYYKKDVGEELYDDEWYKPGIGPIQIIWDNGDSFMRLKSYRVR